MSGIAGIVRRGAQPSIDSLGRMAAAIRHRGPDAYGFYIGQRISLAHVRLSVVDVVAGTQPMTNEDGRIVITYNGEIYNHPELRRELEQLGHTFRTRSDTEVLVHGYEQWGVNLLQRLNGQFAFAIYDRSNESILLARDRFGIRPLFYAQPDGEFFFASEIKSILASGDVSATVDTRGIDEIFTLGAARPPRTPFAGIASLEPGTYGIWKDGAFWLHRYYELDYPEAGEEAADVVEQLDELMLRSVGMRLRADVSVGAHLNGELSSSITASLAASASPQTLRSFSVNLDEARFNGGLEREIAGAIGSIHVSDTISANDVVASLPDLLWHAESPTLGTDAAVVYHLARLAKQSGIKVILSSDGADDLFLGHDLFKEVQIRRFCLRQPGSCWREQLVGRLYPDLMAEEGGIQFWRRYFLESASPHDPLFSHLPRFVLAARIKEFYSPEFKAQLGRVDVMSELRASLPARFFGWSSLNRASYLEMTTHLAPYALGASGDRMAMAHGVECRFPYLDHRLYEFASSLPTGSRLRGLHDKQILRRWAARVLPPRVDGVEKMPAHRDGFTRFDTPTYRRLISDHLNESVIGEVGIFSPQAVQSLLNRVEQGRAADDDVFPRILSTHLWHNLLIEQPVTVAPLPLEGADVVLRETDSTEDAPSLRKLRL